MGYVTQEEVATLLGIAVGDLPANVNVQIEWAGDIVDHLTMNKSTQMLDLSLFQQDRIKKAIAYQIKLWINLGDEMDDFGNVAGFEIGEFSMQFSSSESGSAGGMSSISPKSYRVLLTSGLMNRGINNRSQGNQAIVESWKEDIY